MSDIICILSSDDEDDKKAPDTSKLSPKKQPSQVATKIPSSSNEHIEECFRRKVQSLKQSLQQKKKHEKPSKLQGHSSAHVKTDSGSHSKGDNNLSLSGPKTTTESPVPSVSSVTRNNKDAKTFISPTALSREDISVKISTGQVAPKLSSHQTTPFKEKKFASTAPKVREFVFTSSTTCDSPHTTVKTMTPIRSISSLKVSTTVVETKSSSTISMEPIATTHVSTIASAQPQSSTLSESPFYKPYVSKIIKKSSEQSLNVTTATTTMTTMSTVTSISNQPPTPDCIILDDSDNEEDVNKTPLKNTTIPKVRLEKVVGKLLTSSAGKQSMVHVSSCSTAVRLSLLKDSYKSTLAGNGSTSVTKSNHSPNQTLGTSTMVSTSLTNAEKKVTKHMRIKILEKKLATLENRINQYASKEISLQDMDREESPYIQEANLKEDFIKTWKKYCQLTGEDSDAVINARKKIRVSSSPFPEINREVQKYVNRTGSFPNLFDIKNVCLQANNKYHLDIKPVDLQSIAVDVFTEVGRKLQKHREKELRATSGNILTDLALKEKDPALEDDNLKRKLKHNKKIAKKRTEDVFNDFVKQQYEQEGSNNANDSVEDDDTDNEYESLRKKDLIENKKLKSKLIQKKIKGHTPPSKKLKISESTTVINVTLSSSQDEDLSKKKKIDCRVTFSASPEPQASSVGRIQPPLPKPKSSLNPNTTTMSPKTQCDHPVLNNSGSPSNIAEYPGFPVKKLSSNSLKSKASSTANSVLVPKVEDQSYESPLKRFRSLQKINEEPLSNEQETQKEPILPIIAAIPKKEPSILYKPPNLKKSEIIIVDSDDE